MEILLIVTVTVILLLLTTLMNAILGEAIMYRLRHAEFVFKITLFLATLALSLTYIVLDKYLISIVLFGAAILWATKIYQMIVVVPRNEVYVVTDLNGMPINLGEDHGGKIELMEGRHILNQYCDVQAIVHETEEGVPGFDARNNIVSIDSEMFDTGDLPPIQLEIKGIEIKMNFDKEYTDQFNTFKSVHGDGQNGIILMVKAVAIDILGHFIGAHSWNQIANAKLIKDEFEINGKAQEIIDEINAQLQNAYGINVYQVFTIRVAKVVLPASIQKAAEQKAAMDAQNATRENELRAKMKRAKDAGITLEELDVTEGNNRQGIVITGNNSGNATPLLNVPIGGTAKGGSTP